MVHRQVVPGWSRIGATEFRAAIAAAMAREPDLCARLRRAIKATAGGRVPASTIDLYLSWITEVERAVTAMADAGKMGSTNERSAASGVMIP